MSNAKYTDGPWKKAGRQPENHAINVLGKSGGLVAQARASGGSWSDANANAKLIASAPELLESLEAVMKFWRESKDEEMPASMFDDAMSAIAKAKGL